MRPSYPNLELLEYKAGFLLAGNDKKKRNEQKIEQYEFDAIVFSQLWGNTSTGFDITEDGMPTIGGCAMTREYTTVFHELQTDTWIVFFGKYPCYLVTDANETFLDDLKNRNMASLSEAKRRY